MKKKDRTEFVTIKIAILEGSEYHKEVGIRSLIDLLQETSCGEDTGIRVLEILEGITNNDLYLDDVIEHKS